MTGPIFHLLRFFRFFSRRITSVLGTWTNRRAKASNALNPLGFFAFFITISLYGLQAVHFVKAEHCSCLLTG